MSKNDKTLLSEAITSRMMKLANVKKTLRENFITDRYLEEEEDEMDMEMDMGGGPAPEDEDAAPVGDEPEMGGEMGGEMSGEMGEPEVEQLVSAIADAIESVTGVAVDVEGGEGGEEMPAGDEEMPGPDMDMGGAEEMPPAEEAPEEEVMEGMETKGGNKHTGSSPDPVSHKNKKVGSAGLASQGPGLVKEEEEEDDEEKEDMAESTDRFVEEITRRVAARLLNATKK